MVARSAARRVLAAALALAAAASACGTVGAQDGGPGEPVGSSTAGTTAPVAPSSTTDQGSQTTEEDTVEIRITVGGQEFPATLVDSAAARDLVAQLPATIEMRDHGGVEKTGRLPSPLSLDGQPEGADPDVGDVGYYAPGNDLVLYYGDQSFVPGIVVLGRLDGDAVARIADLHGSVTTFVENR